jgi:hypothetical protein
MLITKIRTGIQKPWAKGILFFFLLTLFGGVGIGNALKRLLGGRTDGVGIVNGQEIPKNLFLRKKHEAESLINSLYQRFGQAAPMIMSMQGINQNPEETALEEIVSAILLDQLVVKMPVYIASDYVDLKLQEPYFMASKLQNVLPQGVITPEGKLNVQAYQEFMSRYGITPDMKAEITQSLSQELALDLIESLFWLPDFAAQEFMNNKKALRKFSIAKFELEDFAKDAQKKQVTDEVLKTFFDEQNNKNKRYYIPAKRNGTRWTFSAQDFQLTISDKELEDYYKKVKHARFIDKPTQIKIREIILDDVKGKGLKQLRIEIDELYQKAIANPKDFAQLAEKFSTGKTAKNGGSVDFFKRGEKDKALERAAFKLKENNETSSVIELEQGKVFALVQRLDRKETEFKSLSQVKDELIKTLKEKKFSIEFVKMASKVTKTQDESDQAFQDFVKKYKGKEEKIDAVAKEEGAVAGRLFSLKKRGDKAVYVQEGKGYILELNDNLQKNLPPFEMLKSYVQKDFYQEQAYKNLTSTLNGLKEKSLKSQKFEIPQGTQLEETNFIDVAVQEEVKKLLDKGVPQEIMLLDKKGGILARVTEKTGYLIRLDEIKKTKDVQDNSFKFKLESQLKKLQSAAFIASLRRTATIKIDTLSDKRNSAL